MMMQTAGGRLVTLRPAARPRCCPAPLQPCHLRRHLRSMRIWVRTALLMERGAGCQHSGAGGSPLRRPPVQHRGRPQSASLRPRQGFRYAGTIVVPCTYCAEHRHLQRWQRAVD